ncbi:Uncharacterised protein [Vibrio cholerae]|nr:Uncharacterised protein [Vibrio cholerae]
MPLYNSPQRRVILGHCCATPSIAGVILSIIPHGMTPSPIKFRNFAPPILTIIKPIGAQISKPDSLPLGVRR